MQLHYPASATDEEVIYIHGTKYYYTDTSFKFDSASSADDSKETQNIYLTDNHMNIDFAAISSAKNSYVAGAAYNRDFLSPIKFDEKTQLLTVTVNTSDYNNADLFACGYFRRAL